MINESNNEILGHTFTSDKFPDWCEVFNMDGITEIIAKNAVKSMQTARYEIEFKELKITNVDLARKLQKTLTIILEDSEILINGIKMKIPSLVLCCLLLKDGWPENT